MNFDLTPEQESFRQELHEFLEKEVAPGVRERDESQDFSGCYDILINKMGPKGWLGLSMPKEYGGMGKTEVEYAIAMLEIGQYDGGLAAGFSVGLSLGTVPILEYGSPEQKEKYLRPLAEGKKLSAFGLTEENAGSDAAMQETTAVRDGDDYILNGKKIYITNAEFAETYSVMAMTDKSKGAKGISAFIVEKGTPGFTFGKQEVKMGIWSSVQKELIFENCRVPAANRLSEEGLGFKAAMKALDVGRIGVAAGATGNAIGAYKKAMEHAKTRITFGQPIITNQAISFMLADMAMQIEAARFMVLNAAFQAASGKPFGKEAAMAKCFCTDVGMKVTTDAVQIMGGMGYLRENDVERAMRDAKIQQIFEGANQIQRMVISRYISKE